MKAVGDALGCCQFYHGVHHVAATCHTEANVPRTFDNELGCFDEILRTFLHRDSSEEGNHLLFSLSERDTLVNDFLMMVAERIYRVVHGKTLPRILMIVVDDCLTRQLTNTHNAVSMVHSVLFDAVHGGIHVSSTSVEVCCVHVDH